MLTELFSDAELGSAPFIVQRSIYRMNQGEAVLLARSSTPAEGCVHPGAPEQLAQLPEEFRREECIVVYTAFPLSPGSNDGISFTPPDRILWNGGAWRVVRLKPWPAFGFVQALAVRVTDET